METLIYYQCVRMTEEEEAKEGMAGFRPSLFMLLFPLWAEVEDRRVKRVREVEEEEEEKQLTQRRREGLRQ